MFSNYRSTILQIALEISRLCIIHILSYVSAEKLKPQTYIPVHSNFSESLKVRMYWYVQQISKQVNFLHFSKILCIIIPPIFWFFFQRKGLFWLPNLKKKNSQSFMIKDFHRFVKHFVIKYHGNCWNSEGGSLSIFQFLIKNPSPTDKFYVSMVYFCAKNEPVLLSFFLGEGPQLLHIFQRSGTMLKNKTQRSTCFIQTNSRMKMLCLSL